MAGKFPESYKDPLYAQLDAGTEKKLELPIGLLSSIRTAGERTDASRVSSAGAKTPYQFIPATQKAILDKYGIDVTLSPENASEGAGLLLQESLKRSKGDVETAVRQYHGGTDTDNWGPINNAYAKRVLASQGVMKAQALSSGFAAFMAANPAVPAGDRMPTAAPAAPAPENDALAAGFGQYLEQQKLPTSADIPGVPGAAERMAAEEAAKPPEPTLGDQVVGALETGATVATGATLGTLGLIGGTVGGLAGAVMTGEFGTPEAMRNIEEQAAAGMTKGTYLPVTQSGQEQAGAVGKVMQAAVPVMGLTAEMGALGQAAGNAGRAGATMGAAGVQRIRAAAPAIAERVERTLRRNPDPATPTPGTQASGGSAGTDMATLRTQNAANLPVPIPLTRGQATRDPMQMRFEGETAKSEQGARIREFSAEQNERFHRNFDAMVDMTEAEVVDLIDVGRSVEKVIIKEAARDKAEIRVAYQKADKAGETAAPVTLSGLVEHLNESAPDAATAPLLTTARGRAIQLGIASEDANGQLVALPTTVKNAERMRQAIGRATDFEATNIRQSAIIKGLIDTSTEALAGPLYRSARRLRENFANKYENRAVVASLLNKKRGSADRQVALEDVFTETILKGTREEIGHVRRVLQSGGDEGAQAWKDLQGATATWIKDEALKNVATDQRGNRIVSAAQFESAIKRLEKGDRLNFIFGKQGAQMMRDLNDLAKVTMTAPPGAINYSNTASVLLAALTEAGVTGSMTGLPVPVLSALRLVAVQAKNRKIQKRVDAALSNRPDPTARPPRPAPPPDRTLH